MTNGMVTYLFSRKTLRLLDGICHRNHISRCDKPACLGRNDFRDSAAGKSDDRRAATHCFGHDEAIWLIPNRGDQRRRGLAHQPCQLALVEVAGISDLPVEVRRDLSGEVVRIGDRTGKHQGPAGLPGRCDRQVRCFFGGDPTEPHQRASSGPQRPSSGIDTVGHHRYPTQRGRPCGCRVV